VQLLGSMDNSQAKLQVAVACGCVAAAHIGQPQAGLGSQIVKCEKRLQDIAGGKVHACDL